MVSGRFAAEFGDRGLPDVRLEVERSAALEVRARRSMASYRIRSPIRTEKEADPPCSDRSEGRSRGLVAVQQSCSAQKTTGETFTLPVGNTSNYVCG